MIAATAAILSAETDGALAQSSHGVDGLFEAFDRIRFPDCSIGNCETCLA